MYHSGIAVRNVTSIAVGHGKIFNCIGIVPFSYEMSQNVRKCERM